MSREESQINHQAIYDGGGFGCLLETIDMGELAHEARTATDEETRRAAMQRLQERAESSPFPESQRTAYAELGRLLLE